MRGLVGAALAIFLAGSNMVNASTTDGPSTVLLLEVWINGRTDHRILRVQHLDDEYFVEGDALARAGLNLNGAEARGSIALKKLNGLSFEIDQTNQRLLIAASADRLPEQVFDLRPSIMEGPQSTSARGASVSYDVSGMASGLKQASAGGTFGLDVSRPTCCSAQRALRPRDWAKPVVHGWIQRSNSIIPRCLVE
jgi:outer membrane usher protein FimD/PapC